MFAMTGDAPVPVPPPSPAAMNTMSEPFKASTISSSESIAACLPTSGLAPAPRPLVDFLPRSSFISALEPSKLCASVLQATKSTPPIFIFIIRLTAFVPPPPTPMTLITAV